jgi:hypothetical protein
MIENTYIQPYYYCKQIVSLKVGLALSIDRVLSIGLSSDDGDITGLTLSPNGLLAAGFYETYFKS